MKKIFIAISFLLSALSGYTQSLVTSNKSWSNLIADYWNPASLSTENLRFTTDTVINDLTYKKVERSIDENQQFWTGYGYIREDSVKRVYYKPCDSVQEQKIYDFNVRLFDTLTVYGLNTFMNTQFLQPMTYLVISIDSILIGDTYRKQIHLGTPEDSTYAIEQWIDSTGNLGGLLHNRYLYVGCDGYTLLCFSEEGIVKYQDPDYDSCFVVTGFRENMKPAWSVRVCPDPVVDQSTLMVENLDGIQEMKVDFFDVTGKIVLSKNFHDRLHLNRKEFMPGLYFFRIHDGSGNILTGKMTVN